MTASAEPRLPNLEGPRRTDRGGLVTALCSGWFVVAVTMVCGILAIAFATTDLAISTALHTPASRFARFIEEFGEVPGVLCMFAAVVILNASRAQRRGPGEVGMKVVMFLLFVAPLLYLHAIRERARGNLTWDTALAPSWWPFLGVAFVAVHVLTRVRGVRFSDLSQWFARVTVSLVLLDAVLLTHVCKFVWGRVRFRDLTAGHADYTPFFLPQGFTGNSSFVSGHAALGWMLLPMLLLTTRATRRTQCATLVVVSTWGVAVAWGRILIGAHYPSDVLFPTALAFALFAALARRFARGDKLSKLTPTPD